MTLDSKSSLSRGRHISDNTYVHCSYLTTYLANQTLKSLSWEVRHDDELQHVFHASSRRPRSSYILGELGVFCSSTSKHGWSYMATCQAFGVAPGILRSWSMTPNRCADAPADCCSTSIFSDESPTAVSFERSPLRILWNIDDDTAVLVVSVPTGIQWLILTQYYTLL